MKLIDVFDISTILFEDENMNPLFFHELSKTQLEETDLIINGKKIESTDTQLNFDDFMDSDAVVITFRVTGITPEPEE